MKKIVTQKTDCQRGGTKKCSMCGKELKTPKERSRKTCCLVCFIKSKTHIGSKHPRWGGVKRCVICDKELVGAARRKTKTCSKECDSKNRSIIRSGNGNPKWRGGQVFCKQCGTEIKHSHRLHVVFCSRKCMGMWQSENLSRENSPHWKGGSSYSNYSTDFNAKLRSSIRKRDNHTCKICGKVQIDLDVHHKDENKSNSKPENLVSLCRSCHSKVHWNPDLLGQNGI